MMKTVLTSAIALVAMAVTASAADMPARGPAVAPAPYVAPVFTWTGFYVGVNAGAAWHGRDNCPAAYGYDGTIVGSLRTDFIPACTSDDTSFTGGVQAGFNWQMGAAVFGLEGDVNWVGNDSRHGFNTYSFKPVSTAYNYTLDGNPQSNLLAGIRGRLGWSFDRALLYMTGGAAFRNSGSNDVIYAYDKSSGVLLATYGGNTDRSNIGWSLGGGLEWAFTNNVSLRVEYLHSQFTRNNGIYTTPQTTSPVTDYYKVAFRNDSSRDSIDVVRFGVNYRFGNPAPAPVLARY